MCRCPQRAPDDHVRNRWWKAMAGADCPYVVVPQDMSGRQIAHEIQRAPEYLAARLAFPGAEGDGPQALPRALRLLYK